MLMRSTQLVARAALRRKLFLSVPQLAPSSMFPSVLRFHTSPLSKEANDAVSPIAPETAKQVPSKEVMLTLDWILEGCTPVFMKARMHPIFEKFEQDVEFSDEIYGYKAKGIDQLGMHITKVRTYFRYKSPYNKISHNGSYLFEDENMLVVLWGLETIDSNIWTYFPSFITGRENKPKIIEGALHFFVNAGGKVYKIVNKKVTDKDRQLAHEFGELKKSQHEHFDKVDRKAAEKALREELER